MSINYITFLMHIITNYWMGEWVCTCISDAYARSLRPEANALLMPNAGLSLKNPRAISIQHRQVSLFISFQDLSYIGCNRRTYASGSLDFCPSLYFNWFYIGNHLGAFWEHSNKIRKEITQIERKVERCSRWDSQSE